jgi:hypothetical protein
MVSAVMAQKTSTENSKTQDRTSRGANEGVKESVALESLRDARMGWLSTVSSAMLSLRNSLLNIKQAMFPRGVERSDPKQVEFNKDLRDGVRLPTGHSVQFISKYGENVEGRIYIEHKGIGVSIRRDGDSTFVYAYRYDPTQGHNQKTIELACFKYKARNDGLPEVVRLNQKPVDPSSDIKVTPEMLVVAAYVSLASIALQNLRRQSSSSLDLTATSFKLG